MPPKALISTHYTDKTKLCIRPSVSLGYTLIDDLEIKAVTPVWRKSLLWKYWFYLNAKELFQKKNLLNSNIKICR